MLGTIVKMIAYYKAPKATFAVLHPKASAKLRAAQWDMKHGYASRASAIGAALIALPVGYLIGKAVVRRRPNRASLLMVPARPSPDDCVPGPEPRETELL